MPHCTATPKVSILIPVYNGAKVVHRAIESALDQTHKNIEIIIVNDGSTDDTQKILAQYQKSNPEKIKVISQKNKGIGITRNVLIDAANGDYIVYLDADDWLKKDYVETMLRAIGDGDLVICGYECYDTNYQLRGGVVPGQESFAKYSLCSTAGKIWRRKFLISNNLRYEPMNIGEDALFSVIAYSKTNSIVTLSYAGYCNYQSSQSTTRQVKYSEKVSFYTVMNKLVKKLHGSEILHDEEFQFFVLKSLLVDIFLYKNGLTTRDLIHIYRQSIHWYQNFLKQNGARLRLRIQKGAPAAINLVTNGLILLTKLHLDWLGLMIIKKAPVSML